VAPTGFALEGLRRPASHEQEVVYPVSGENVSLHLGHSIRSRSTRLTRSGVIVNPHFGHVLSSDARTLSRLILRDRGIAVARF
jgi:extradiol dioxygenase family protein